MRNKSLQGIRLKALTFSFVLSMILCLPAFGEDMTVRKLIGWCNGEDPDFKEYHPQFMCSSWIGGFLSAMIYVDGMKTLKGEQIANKICAPGLDVDKISQLQDALVQITKEDSKLQNATARAILYSVINNLYACKK